MTGPDRENNNSSPLRELAAQLGIISEYFDLAGELHSTSDATRRAFLAALGIQANTDATTRDALSRVRAEQRDEMIPPVRVVRSIDPLSRVLPVRAPSKATTGRWWLEVDSEEGDTLRSEGQWRAEDTAELRLPAALPLGYHKVRLTMASNRYEWDNEQTLIIVPSRCVTPTDVLPDRRAFGVTTNLYTIRSANNWGVGDFADLATLAEWAGSAGADFVGTNPLHALMNRSPDVSPYSPVSRIFRNPIYIDVTRVPEFQDAPIVRDWLASNEVGVELGALRRADMVQYEAVMRLKSRALTALHRVFTEKVRGTKNPRAQAYTDFVAANDPTLTRFAAWMTIVEANGRDPRKWPSALRAADAGSVKRFSDQNAVRVDFHRWLQFEADRQLGEASLRGRGAGMRIGMYQDLAIGTSPASADAWAFPGLFVNGVTIGAPPDPYSARGQNWALPPIDPRALKRTRYDYFIKMLRSGFRHAGALRIDHVMGLFRLYWIPEGASAADGAYVRYPSEDMLGIIALESARHNALVVGEDLGTVPPEVPPALTRWGVMSSKVMYFERNSDGEFKRASEYPPQALATANTHDMPTLAGFWQGRDIEVRASVGSIPSAEAANQARAERERDRSALARMLKSEDVLSDEQPASANVLTTAVHSFLCRTPSELVGLSLDDLGGEDQSVNIPGVGPDRHPSWTRKMRLSLEEITESEAVRTALRCRGRARAIAS